MKPPILNLSYQFYRWFSNGDHQRKTKPLEDGAEDRHLERLQGRKIMENGRWVDARRNQGHVSLCFRPVLYNTHICVLQAEGQNGKKIWLPSHTSGSLTLHQFRAFSPVVKQKPALPMFYFTSATNDIIQNLPINAKTHLQNQKQFCYQDSNISWFQVKWINIRCVDPLNPKASHGLSYVHKWRYSRQRWAKPSTCMMKVPSRLQRLRGSLFLSSPPRRGVPRSLEAVSAWALVPHSLRITLPTQASSVVLRPLWISEIKWTKRKGGSGCHHRIWEPQT